MKDTTHAFVAVAAAMAAGAPSPGGIMPAVLGSWLPDTDTPYSMAWAAGAVWLAAARLPASLKPALKAGKVEATIVVVAYLALALLGRHRGFTHSLAGFAAAAGSYILIFGFQALLPFGVGYFSHLLLDAMTPAGVPLYWPSAQRFGFPLVRTGGFVEYLIRNVAFAAAFALAFVKSPLWPQVREAMPVFIHDLMQMFRK